MNQERKITYKVSPLWVIAVILVVGMLGGGIYYYIDTSDANEREKFRLSGAIQKLKADVAKLTAGYSKAKLDVVRKETGQIKQSLITGAEADAFVAKLQPVWSVMSRTEEANSEFVHRRYRLVRGSDQVSVWPEIYAVFKKMEGMPSFAVNSFDIQTIGDSRRRDFNRITVDVSVYVKKPE